LRIDASLLISEGHVYARKYPLAMLWTEAELARERINTRLATEAALLHAVAMAVMTPKGKGVPHLNKTLRMLTRG
jgi:hypothetical protein